MRLVHIGTGSPQAQLHWDFATDGSATIGETFYDDIADSDGVLLLPGFVNQRGAIDALSQALNLGKQVFYVYDWDDECPFRRIA